MKAVGLRVSIDRGGTFTDVVAQTDDGRRLVKKLLSQSPAFAGADPAAIAVEALLADLKKGAGAVFEQAVKVEEIRLGTTVATNALLERRGEPTVLITNKGFGDALIIGYQNRPDIFALDLQRPRPLFERVIEVDCRVDKDGNVRRKLDEKTLLAAMVEARESGDFRSAAIVFMHGYKFPEQERIAAKLANQAGFEFIYTSHTSSNLIRFVSRGDTTLVNAYLTPPLQRYVDGLQKDFAQALPAGDSTPLYFMKSDGGLAERAAFEGKDAILSGPAGGVIGAAAMASAWASEITGGEGLQPAVVGFDMGGTSTDVCYIEGPYERQEECIIGGVRLRTPMLAVHTVAAGGGSILDFDGSAFTVGPLSAGALPGPACYGNGGPTTITDANLVLGKIAPSEFPRVFGPDGKAAISLEAARASLETLREGSRFETVEATAEGFLEIAIDKMAQAINKVSLQKGHDLAPAVLVPFGGAGGQHACALATRLGIKKILFSPLAGVLSAYGIGQAPRSHHSQKTVRRRLNQNLIADLRSDIAALTDKNLAELRVTGAEHKVTFALAYRGSDTALPLIYSDGTDDAAALRERFHRAHEKLFGFSFEEKDDNSKDSENRVEVEIILENITVESTIAAEKIDLRGAKTKTKTETKPVSRPWQIYQQGAFCDAGLYLRDELKAGAVIDGPALIAEDTSTAIIESGWRAVVLADGCLLANQMGTEAKARPGTGVEKRKKTSQNIFADPVKLALFNNLFMAIAEDMGVTLQKVSHSVNIKERLDFSCAIFDRVGRLIANAPHIPVHLGSMGDSVVSLIKAHGDRLKPGEAYALNNPYNGGTHLPDVTVISPVFARQEKTTATAPPRLLFFVASRGHHADIGGISPGSMPPDSSTIEQEGVLIDNFRVLADHKFLAAEFSALLASAKYPARNIAQNSKDLQAQIAANNRGIAGLYGAIDRHGLPMIEAYMSFVRQNAATAIRRLLPSLEGGEASQTMDNGSTIKVKITLEGKNSERAIVDFSGTSPAAENNFNAPLAVTRAAVLYVFRTLANTDIPLNDGCSEPLTLVVPPGSLLNPDYPRAVVAGNVETSQMIVDTLYQALGKLACSQGTMNNFTFGDSRYQYYETIAGGSGAGPGFNGTDAIQTHMTNSRLTDPEILEERFPVLLEEFSIRQGSGGAGLYPGGNGARRKIRFLQAMNAAILSNRREAGASGLKGAGSGAVGQNFWLDRDDKIIARLKGTAGVKLEAMQAILIETPGGGGCN